MSTVVSNTIQVVMHDANNEEVDFTIDNINPAISSYATLSNVAKRAAALSESSFSRAYVIQKVEITSD